MVSYLALGPVAVVDESGDVPLGGGNQRSLLAVLLAHRDRQVSVSTLAGALWPTHPPASELHAIQTVVSRTRRALGEHRGDIVTTMDGYQLISPHCDVARFEAILDEAAATHPEAALAMIDEGLSLWRGDAFGTLAELDAVRTEAIRLDQLRLNTVELRFQLLSDLGLFDAAIPELEAFAAVQPLRERARGLLMQALYWTGRQADALAVYADYRRLLGDGLGLEPSLDLKRLEESIVLDTLERADNPPSAGPRLYGRRGTAIREGPSASTLEEMGWDLMWGTDHNAAIEVRQRAYARLLEEGDRPGAARVAIWLGVNAAIRLKNPVAFGWLARAGQLLEGEPPGASHGLLAGLMGMVEVLAGDLDAALAHGTEAQHIGVGSGSRDVEALGKVIRGWATIRLGGTKPGLALMDEAMASAIGGELGRYVSALVYCRTICACLDLMDYQRATEWTDEIAAVRDAGGMPDLPGDCRTHRVAVLLVKGDWAEGTREAAVACAETETFDLTHLGIARGLRGEIMLRRGDLDEAEEQFAAAQQLGSSPYPGLALLALARGDGEGAYRAIADAADELTHDPLRHAQLLPAVVEIALAAGKVNAAATAAQTLGGIAARFRTSALRAYAKHATGSVQLAEGDAREAVRTLRAAWRLWMQVGSDYRAAVARMSLARALDEVGRATDAVTEAAAARDSLFQLGAAGDVAAADEFLSRRP
jgi:DNA-binding SARP family transcriptional activator